MENLSVPLFKMRATIKNKPAQQQQQ